MKRVFRYGITALLIVLFALGTLCGCGGFFGSNWGSGNNGGSSNSSGSTQTPSTGGSSSSGSGSSSGGSSSGGSSSGSSGGGSTQTPATPVNIPESPITINVRSETAKITDSGRASQKMDKVLISDYFDVKAAYSAGYTKLKVTFSFEVKEMDDGYQYVFFYADTTCKGNSFFDKVVDEFYDPEDPSLLYEYRLEHGGTTKDTSWGPHSFSTSLKMSRLKDDLYIRYGASGKQNDDWQNRNVVVTFQAVK